MLHRNTRATLVLALSLLGIQLNAAPLPSAWNDTGAAIYSEQFLSVSNLYRGESLAQSTDQVFTGLRPLTTQASEIACGVVSIYKQSELRVGAAAAVQQLSRGDAGLNCEDSDEFGTGLVFLNDQRLVVAAPGPFRNNSGVGTGSGELFFYHRIGTGENAHWQFESRLTGADFGILRLGSGLASDGQRLFVFEHSARRFDAPTEITGINVLARDGHGQWQRQTRIPIGNVDNPILNRFFVSGDQILLYTLTPVNQQGSLSVLQERHDQQGDWVEVQRIDAINNLDAPENMRSFFAPAQVSGDWFVTRPREFRGGNQAFNVIAQLYRRDQRGLWRYQQSIDVRGTEQDLGLPLADTGTAFLSLQFHTAAISGADLVIAWLQGNSSFELVHYRLDKDEHFRAVQALGESSGFGSGSPIIDIGDRSILVPSFDGTTSVYTRPEGSNFTFNRGLTGAWWFGPQRSGQGVGLEVLPNDRVQMVWLNHDLSGQQQWLFGAGEIDVDRVRIQLVQPLGGEFGPGFDNASVQRVPWGEVELVFKSCEIGELRYQSDTMGSGTLPLIRLSKVDGLDCGEATASELARRWSGSWFDPSHNGEGLMMHVTPTMNGPRLSSLWMSYQVDGRQAAFYAASDINSNSFALFDSVIRPTGLNFDGSGVLQRNPWGQYELLSNECDQSLLSYVSSENNFGSGQLDLIRFTRPLGTGCF